MSEVKHTPLPWKTESSWDDFTVVGADGAEIVFQDGPHGTPTLTKDDAEFIVRACNSHYEMLEALEDVLRSDCFPRLNILAQRAVRAAIAKATGQ